MSWLKAMAWDLRSNVEDEIDRAISTTGLDDEQMADIYPDYPYDTRPTITGGNAGAKAPATSRKSGAGKPGGSTAGGGDAPRADSGEDEARAGGEVAGVNAPRTDAE
ncbi:MAG: penicillin acylase family protein, partial [Brevibacterium aurantiacum]